MSIPTRFALFSLLAAAVLVAVSVPGTGQPKGDNDAANAQKKRAADLMDKIPESKSLRWNANTIDSWAGVEGDDVLPRLLKLYDNPPEEFQTNVPYLTAAAFRRRHDAITAWSGQLIRERAKPSESDVKALRKFLKNHVNQGADIWGVYCAGCLLALERDDDIDMELLGYIGDDRYPAVNRSALLEALSRSGFEATRRVLEVMLDEKFSASSEAAVLLEAIVWAAARAYKPLHKEDQPLAEKWHKVFEGILTRLEEDRKVFKRSLRESALALQYCFGTKHPYQYPSMWRMLFKTGKDPLSDTNGNTVASFMGLDVMGERVLFLIDASDSMLNPLTDADKEALRNPITGDKKKKKGRKKGYEVDWDRVKTRFDAAREHVKWTLSRLGKERQVAIVLFGEKAEPMSCTRRFIKCAPGNVSKINATLDGIRPREPAPEMKEARPDGVLLGETDYYNALLAAYRLGRGGMIKSPREHCDLKLIEEGADSIFLLSDGAPIRDGFSGATPKIEREYESYRYYGSKQPGEGEWVEFPASPATKEREIEVRDPETGNITKRKIPGSPARPASRMWRRKETVKTEFSGFDTTGPYVGQSFFGVSYGSFELRNLLAEVQRMNLVRRVQIHCVGIGEAQMTWLEPIANEGRGQAVFFGKDKDSDPRLPRRLPRLPD